MFNAKRLKELRYINLYKNITDMSVDSVELTFRAPSKLIIPISVAILISYNEKKKGK